jgi:hypothetical protein
LFLEATAQLPGEIAGVEEQHGVNAVGRRRPGLLQGRQRLLAGGRW